MRLLDDFFLNFGGITQRGVSAVDVDGAVVGKLERSGFFSGFLLCQCLLMEMH